VLAAARGVHALVPLMLGAMAQDQERATGPWQSEWLGLPQIFVLASGALAHAGTLAAGIVVEPARMRANLDATRGLIMAEAVMMALADRMGRAQAHHAVEQACARAIAESRPLGDVLADDRVIGAQLDRSAIAGLMDPAHYVGEAGAVVDRVVARARKVWP
jgi:3-carboxy-cis,cis-muconate cycloisomerase